MPSASIAGTRAGQGRLPAGGCSSVAASGGYWIACGCNAVWANPTAIVGSIGVARPDEA